MIDANTRRVLAVLGGDDEVQPWERQKGESVKQYHAFEVYRDMGHERTLAKVAEKLGRAIQTVGNMSSTRRWAARVDAWERHQSKLRLLAAESEVVKMAERHAQIAGGMLSLVATGVLRHQTHLRENPKAMLAIKDLTVLAKIGSDLERFARGVMSLEDPSLQAQFVRASASNRSAAVEVGKPEGEDLSMEEMQYAQWIHQYVQPEGAFLPHRQQRLAINSEARFVALVCGVQSGKTTGGGVAFWRRIKQERQRLHARGERGFYWMIAPNSIVGEVMCEAFERFAPPGEIVAVRGMSSGRTWELRDGSRVQFRSGEKADKLVGRRVHGAWLDEFTILKREVWVVSIRQRLATTNGWALFTGTPRGQNWAYKEVWQRAQLDDDNYDEEYAGFTWPSKENPAIDPAEVESARRQLPAAYFRREWEASWEAFHGQIYQEWKEGYAIPGLASRAVPVGTESYGGKDFGFSNPGCLLMAYRLPNGEWWIVDEVYEREKLPDWWKDEIANRWARFEATTIWADPAEAEQIAALVDDGIPVERGPNPVTEGIRHVAKLIKQGRILVDKDRCPHLLAQLVSYKWEEDSQGNRQEIPEKKNDHAVDALRYLLMGYRERRPPAEVRGYGSAKPKSRGRRRR